MRVKLSYSVDVEDVLTEAAKIIGLCGDDLQHCVALFNDTQKELNKGGIRHAKGKAEVPPNTFQIFEMLEEFRSALFNVDTRLSEVVDIIKGYDDYRRAVGSPPQDETPPVPDAEAAAPQLSPGVQVVERAMTQLEEEMLQNEKS